MDTLILLWVFLAGLTFFACGLYLYRREWAFLRKSMPVTVAVKELRDEKDIEGENVSRAVFEVMDGPYAGRIQAAEFRSYPAAHKVGDVVKGLFDPKSGRIESVYSNSILRLISALSALAGAGLIGFAAFRYMRGN